LSDFVNKSSSKLNSILSSIVECTNDAINYDEGRKVLLTIIDKLVNDKSDPEIIATGIFCINAMLKKNPILLKEFDENGELIERLNEKDSLWIGEISQ